MSSLIFVAFCLLFGKLGETFQCKDENNQAVDWYVMYKVNMMTESSLPLARAGSIYVYITSSTLGNGWQLTTKGVDSTTSMLANTLAPAYDSNTRLDSSTLLYNDNPPYIGGTRGDRGHSKGVLMANAETGFWLIHSVPMFPDISGGSYSYPDSGKRNAQSFLCLSVNADQVETIAHSLINPRTITKPPYNNKATITTRAGVQFTSFAKSGRWNKDLYQWVGPQLGSTLLVQTWRNGPQKMDNDCQRYHIFNIHSVVVNVNSLSFLIKHSDDHSKWAVSNTNNQHWVCIGDVNRAATQFRRGGGTVCVNLPQLWVAWRNLANQVQVCPNTG